MKALAAILFLIAAAVIILPQAPTSEVLDTEEIEVVKEVDPAPSEEEHMESWRRAFRYLKKDDRFEVSVQTPASSKIPPAMSKPLSPDAPMLAIVVDDCGGNLTMAEELLDLELPLTLAIIPHLRYSESTAALAALRGVPYLVHVPMQALGDPDGMAGKGRLYAIGVGMNENTIKEALFQQIDAYPDAFGINNHRGSRATSDARTMGVVMEALKGRSLVFLDSNTTPKTVAYRTAQEAGLRTTKNEYFLDNQSDRAYVASRVLVAAAGAAKRGRAVAICHLRPETLAYLKTASSAAIEREHGVRLVTLPEYMEYLERSKGDDDCDDGDKKN